MRIALLAALVLLVAGCQTPSVAEVEATAPFTGDTRVAPRETYKQLIDVADRSGLRISIQDSDQLKFVADNMHPMGYSIVRYVFTVAPAQSGAEVKIRTVPERALLGNSWPRRLWDHYCELYPDAAVPVETPAINR